MARNQPSKQKRRKPWVRYERDHSLSAGHMDWTEYNGKQCRVILYDSSRKILAGIECDNATAEQSIKGSVQKVLDEYGHIRRIREVITDHGTQFWASRRAPKGQTQHSFEMFLQEQNVKHILFAESNNSTKQRQSRTMVPRIQKAPKRLQIIQRIHRLV